MPVDVEFEKLVRPARHAFGEEVNMFMHVHLRGYDKDGDGKQMHAEYYDKYGAPMQKENSWVHGYRAVEEEIVKHYNRCETEGFDFPMPALVAGATHLYSLYHHEKPWNWTGFVPKQSKWCYYNKFFQNRHFMQIRGNEIQNNLWDYDPHEENSGVYKFDTKYEQIVPDDAYKGGYWFYGQPWGRYLHIIALKSMDPHSSDKEPECKRYNYIVHPLAYRGSEDTLPDDSVDAMQWTICNVNDKTINKVPKVFPATSQNNNTGEVIHDLIEDEDTVAAFDDETNAVEWSDRCHGLEVYNDFTYYYSASPLDEGKDDPWKGGNGFLYNKEGTPNNYVHWFNSYPLEFCEFLVETSLRHGNYMHMISANDAMYVRNTVVVDRENGTVATNAIRHEPRQHVTSKLQIDHKHQFHTLRENLSISVSEKESEQKNENRTFIGSMPYEHNTVFGYTALIDPEMKLKTTVYGEHPYIRQISNLDKGEYEVMDYLINGLFFGHTGIYDIFNYRDNDGKLQQEYPIMINNKFCVARIRRR